LKTNAIPQETRFQVENMEVAQEPAQVSGVVIRESQKKVVITQVQRTRQGGILIKKI